MKIIILLFFLNLVACSSQQMALKSDYQESLASYRRGDYEQAKKEFPNKEKKGFITSTEKLMLDLVGGEPQPYLYLDLAKNLEKRQVTYVSQEAANFFYMETEEGYYPAEHEVISFHILLGYAFAKRNLPEEACVEARRASEYLEGSYDNQRSEFDDPALRLWLAGLFTYCGEWEHAKVDLRVAAKQLANPQLKALSLQDKPPAHIYLALLGDGPEVQPKNNSNGSNINNLDKVEFISDLPS
ncbi:hypothetical protein H6775_04035, partial [Candidatus Nomurabacteria bacterium]|nr:hypothetical protein [Candidatus Nomurabacteria bacterium]